MDRGGTLLGRPGLMRRRALPPLPGRKGQFTIFVILGIVLLATFGFALYARTLIVRAQIDTQAAKVVSDALDTTPITYYVTRCLQDATHDAIATATLQGGIIYDFQGGLTQFDPANQSITWMNLSVPEYLDGAGQPMRFIVPYGIKQQDDPGCVETPTPAYPYTNAFAKDWAFNFSANGCGSRYDQGIFGRNMLPKLCDENGPNRRNISGITCLLNTYGANQTVQQQLEAFIANKVRTCVDFSIFSTTLGNDNISVENSPSVEFTFAKQGSLITATYPFTVYVHKTTPIVKMVSFQVGSEVPVKEFYTFIYSLISSDITKPDFSLIGNYTSIYHFLVLPHGNETTLTRTPDACPGCATPGAGEHADLVSVRDSVSDLDGHPLIVDFLVENRWPALDYIHATTPGTPYDLSVKEGQQIIIAPQGYDPDDSTLTYNYSGWKETEDSQFDIECCNTHDCATDPFVCTTIVPGPPGPGNWTASADYQLTRRTATYQTKSGDAGWHEVMVQVFKRGQLSDAQSVKILIFDSPKAVADGHAAVPGFGTDASIEDPYVLDGSRSTASKLGATNPTLASYDWIDSTGDFMPFTTTQAQYTLPATPNLAIDPNPPAAFSSICAGSGDTLAFSQVGDHTLGLTVTESGGSTSPQDQFTIAVHRCLPYRDLFSPAWPYNNYDRSDPNAYLGDHACCSDGSSPALPAIFNPLPPGTQCYTETIYGGIRALDDYDTAYGNDVKYPPGTYTGLFTTTSPTGDQVLHTDVGNDVYSRTFTRDCDGTRGNTCTGAAQEQRTNVIACNDITGPNQVRRCQGPQLGIFMAQPAGCENYGWAGSFNFERSLNPLEPGWCADYAPSLVDYNVPVANDYAKGSPAPSTPFSCRGYCDYAGSCSATVPTDCVCAYGDSMCDGLTAWQVKGTGGGNTIGAQRYWCSKSCTNVLPDAQQEACNYIHNKPVGNTCAQNETNCWMQGSGVQPAQGWCCEGNGMTGDTYPITGSNAWCINGEYQDNPDYHVSVCNSATGTNGGVRWFGMGQCCNNGPLDAYSGSAATPPVAGCCSAGVGQYMQPSTFSGTSACTWQSTLFACSAARVGSTVAIFGPLPPGPPGIQTWTCNSTSVSWLRCRSSGCAGALCGYC